MRILAAVFLIARSLLAQPVAPAKLKVTPGKARWAIKTSLAPNADPKKAKTIPLADFLALPNPAGVKDNDARFKEALIPAEPGARFAEGEIVRTRGFLRLVAGEPDGDFHIQISETPDTMENCLIVEVPKPDSEFVKNSPVVLESAERVRNFVVKKLVKGADPTGRTMVMTHPPLVQVTGQLFFDDAHVAGTAKGDFRGKKIKGRQLPSKTPWEIHPVTDMTFARQ